MEEVLDIKGEILQLLKSIQRKGMDKLIQFLEDSDYFSAPASTKYHGAYERGLSIHSHNVLRCFRHKNKVYKLGLSDETIILVSLLHDICKVNFYTKQQRWKKDDNNKWESYEIYAIEDSFPMGHGEKSVIMLLRFIELTDLEIALIRWHMGFSVPKEEYIMLNIALQKYPEIAALYSADLEASFLLEKQ